MLYSMKNDKMQFTQQLSSSCNTVRNGRKESLFFTSAPPLQDLCAVYITVPSQQMKSGSVNNFQPQVIKCRELIFTEPEIIASPMLGGKGRVLIIMQISLFKSGRLQSRFQRMKVEMDKPKRVTPADYQSCLKYTFLARLAPLWNKVGNFLIQGREFVVSPQKLNAVTMDLTVNESELYLHLKASNVRVPPVCLQELNISPRVIEEFLMNQEDDNVKIDDYSIDNRWCHILPSMKKGQIVSVMRHIPSDSPFNSYKDVKKYWKNMYGYRLPETEEGMLYYQVFFKPIGHTLFTYPECCVRLRDITSFNCADPAEVMQQLLDDIHTKMPVLCGHRIKFESEAHYAVPTLTEADQEESMNEQPNLRTSVPSSQVTRGVYEKRVNQYTPWKPSGLQVPATVYNESTNNSTMNRQQDESHTMKVGNSAFHNPSDTDYWQNSRSGSYNPVMESEIENKKDQMQMNQIDGRSIGNNFSRQRNVPGMQGNGKELQAVPGTMPRMVPIFKPKLPSNQGFNLTKHSIEKKTVPLFKNYQRRNSVFSHGSNSNDMFADLEKLKAKLGNIAEHNGKENTRKQSKPISLKPIMPPQFQTKTFSNNYNEVNSLRPSVTHSIMPANLARTPNMIGRNPIRSMTPLPAKLTTVSTPSKRSILDESIDGELKSKKPRAKPKVQEGIDIESLARLNQLAKVNTLTLVTWLKSNDIVCRNRDKKADLVEKVNQYLHLNISEQ